MKTSIKNLTLIPVKQNTFYTEIKYLNFFALSEEVICIGTHTHTHTLAIVIAITTYCYYKKEK